MKMLTACLLLCAMMALGEAWNPVVAFSASAEYSGAFGPFNGEKTLVFNNVITNVRGAYNKDTGVFTAPFPGVYHFTFFYHAGGERRAKLMLFKDNVMVVMTSDHVASDGADNGGNGVVLQLGTGQRVYVQMAAGSHVWASNRQVTFSGFLIG